MIVKGQFEIYLKRHLEATERCCQQKASVHELCGFCYGVNDVFDWEARAERGQGDS